MKLYSFWQVECELSGMSLIIFVCCPETYKAPSCYLQIFRLTIFKHQIYSMLLNFQLMQGRQTFPKDSKVQNKPSIVRIACSTMSKQNNLDSFYLDLTSEEESIVDKQRWRVEFIPSEQTFKIWSCYLVAQILFAVHAGHIIYNFLLEEVLSDEDGSAWYFRGRFVDPGQLVEQSSFSSVRKTYNLYPFDEIILYILFKCLNPLLVRTSNQHHLNISNLLQNGSPLTTWSIRYKLLHPLPHNIQNEMFVEILWIYYVCFVDNHTELDVLGQKFVENEFFETAGYVQHVDNVHEESWDVFVFFQDFGQQQFCSVEVHVCEGIELFRQFVVVLEGVAASTENLSPLLFYSFDGLLLVFVLIEFFLQSQQHFNIVQVIQTFGLVVKYFDVEFFLDMADDLQHSALGTFYFLSVGIFDDFDVIFYTLLQSLLLNVSIFLLVLTLQDTVASVTAMVSIVPLY